MKDSELDQILKSAPVPDRPQAYWDQFSARVLATVQWLQSRQPAEAALPDGEPFDLRPRLRFATVSLALAAILLLLGSALLILPARRHPITNSQLATARKYFREIEALFPNQVRAIVFDRQGPHLALAERADVPASAPLFLRICVDNGCRDYLTFSGQEIQLDGQTLTVLADAHGGIILAGSQFVWSSTARIGDSGDLRIEARNLGLTAM
jgi:hypothetical protein